MTTDKNHDILLTAVRK